MPMCNLPTTAEFLRDFNCDIQHIASAHLQKPLAVIQSGSKLQRQLAKYFIQPEEIRNLGRSSGARVDLIYTQERVYAKLTIHSGAYMPYRYAKPGLFCSIVPLFVPLPTDTRTEAVDACVLSSLRLLEASDSDYAAAEPVYRVPWSVYLEQTYLPRCAALYEEYIQVPASIWLDYLHGRRSEEDSDVQLAKRYLEQYSTLLTAQPPDLPATKYISTLPERLQAEENLYNPSTILRILGIHPADEQVIQRAQLP